jgi:hypothetical protein
MGQTGAHASLFVKQEAGGAVRFPRSLRVVGWGWAERLRELPVGCGVDAVVTPKISTWQGSGHVEAELADLRVR